MEAREKGSALNDSAAVRKQYGTAEKLNTRISIHSKYSVNRQGFGNWILSQYQIRPGMSVLELGCGTGDMWAGKGEIIGRCSRFVLSDFSEGMLDKAKETLGDGSGIEYRVIDIQDIPFADHTFDIVIANMMLYHVPDLPRGLREVKRVLKENGTFYCATYGENGMMEYIYRLFSAYQVRRQVNDNFTLQNGAEKLRPFFADVQRLLYEDALEVTHAEDLVDYILSLTGMTDLQQLPQEELRAVLERNMTNGVLRIPKEYGMFVAKPGEGKAVKIASERLTPEEYIDFLKRTDLGSQYPRERFQERIEKLLGNVSVSLVARNGENRVIGVLLGLTDFAYWLYVTDLGVDRAYERQGIGRSLMKAAHELAGGEKDIAVYLIANEHAIPFYEKLGMKKADDVMQYNHIEWTDFTV